MAKGELLFNSDRLDAYLEAKRDELAKAVDQLPSSTVLQSDLEDVAARLADEYQLSPLVLHDGDSDITIQHEEARVDVSRNPAALVFDRSKPLYFPGTVVTFYVPFDGNPNLLTLQASRFTLNPPRADIRGLRGGGGGELVFSYETTNQDGERIKRDFGNDLSSVRNCTQWSGEDVRVFNTGLQQFALERLKSRHQRLTDNMKMAESFGYAIRQREGAPKTYQVPAVRKKAAPAIPTSAATADPALPTETYEHILVVMTNMVEVMERSPRAFARMGEEDIRFHFLVQLNGQYDGQAVAEAFNYKGRTDILVMWQGQRIFMAECKFWDGPKALGETVEQLLKYVTWRDTKTAIIVFNRNRRISTVLSAIPGAVEAHPNFRRTLTYPDKRGFRYIMATRDDPDREFLLTVLVFDVPSTQSDSPDVQGVTATETPTD
jgi:hypothetical protein